jgi:hypothetical protein
MRLLLAVLLLVVGQVARGEDSLCNKKESIVFSCHVEKKIISLCREAQSPRDLTYRYGVRGRLDVVYPARRSPATGAFYRATLPLFGGAVETITFTRSGYEYSVYSKVDRTEGGSSQESRIPNFEDGVVISRQGKQLRQLVCDDGGDGFREPIDWIPNRLGK